MTRKLGKQQGRTRKKKHDRKNNTEEKHITELEKLRSYTVFCMKEAEVHEL